MLSPCCSLPYRGPMQATQPILDLGPGFYDPVAAATFPAAIPRFRNHRWAERVGLAEIEWERHFARFAPLPGNLPEPLALRYHGHQFRHYNPDLGDGRGFLFAQLREPSGARRLLDLGTKGSGTTPWSRQGDGRLTLKGGVREVLATEMLEALGVDTSKTFALFETGEDLVRGDEPSPTRSAVLTRLSHGHIRIGTFQRLAFLSDTDGLTALTRYCLTHFFNEPGDDPLRLLDRVCDATARLAASYIAAGFVHGVLNSDNINVTGESFDYGPWRFAPEWDEGFTAAYFDHAGLYAFGRQPEAIQWDVAQFAGCLALIGDAPALVRRARDLVGAVRGEPVRSLGGAARDRAARRRGPRVGRGLARRAAHARGRHRSLVLRLARRTSSGRGRLCRRAVRAACAPPCVVASARLTHDYWGDPEPCSMLIDEVEAIWAAIAERDDWAPFEAKIAAIRRMGDAMQADAP